MASTLTVLLADPPPTVRVTLAWDPSPSPNIEGYLVYFGASSGNYTNVIDVGNVTSVVISNLVVGTTYYFAASAYDIVGLESVLSTEVSYTVRLPGTPQLQLALNAQAQAVLTGTGPAGVSYNLLVSTDLQRWTTLTNLTMGTDGACRFTDAGGVIGQTPGRYYRLERTSP